MAKFVIEIFEPDPEVGCGELSAIVGNALRQRQMGYDEIRITYDDGRDILPCGCLRTSIGAHRVSCPDYPQGRRPWRGE